jgi:hypothetical protein
LPDAEKNETPREEESLTCPICGKGKMKTYQIVDGYGQITWGSLSVVVQFMDSS